MGPSDGLSCLLRRNDFAEKWVVLCLRLREILLDIIIISYNRRRKVSRFTLRINRHMTLCLEEGMRVCVRGEIVWFTDGGCGVVECRTRAEISVQLLLSSSSSSSCTIAAADGKPGAGGGPGARMSCRPVSISER